MHLHKCDLPFRVKMEMVIATEGGTKSPAHALNLLACLANILNILNILNITAFYLTATSILYIRGAYIRSAYMKHHH